MMTSTADLVRLAQASGRLRHEDPETLLCAALMVASARSEYPEDDTEAMVAAVAKIVVTAAAATFKDRG